MGVYGPDGYETEDGRALFDHNVETPFGALGNLQTDWRDGKFYLTDTPPVVLIRRNHGIDWQDLHATVQVSPFGFSVFHLQADNGFVTYRLVPNELAWEDDPEDGLIKRQQLAVLLNQDWELVLPPPPKFVSSVETKDMKFMEQKSEKL